MLRNSLYIEKVKKRKKQKKKNDTRKSGCFFDAAEVAEYSIDALTDLRSNKEYIPKIGTILAFFTVFELNDVYRDELLIMTELINEIDKEMYQLYQIMRDTKSDEFTVHKVNQYLRDIVKHRGQADTDRRKYKNFYVLYVDEAMTVTKFNSHNFQHMLQNAV